MGLSSLSSENDFVADIKNEEGQIFSKVNVSSSNKHLEHSAPCSLLTLQSSPLPVSENGRQHSGCFADIVGGWWIETLTSLAFQDFENVVSETASERPSENVSILEAQSSNGHQLNKQKLLDVGQSNDPRSLSVEGCKVKRQRLDNNVNSEFAITTATKASLTQNDTRQNSIGDCHSKYAISDDFRNWLSQLQQVANGDDQPSSLTEQLLRGEGPDSFDCLSDELSGFGSTGTSVRPPATVPNPSTSNKCVASHKKSMRSCVMPCSFSTSSTSSSASCFSSSIPSSSSSVPSLSQQYEMSQLTFLTEPPSTSTIQHKTSPQESVPLPSRTSATSNVGLLSSSVTPTSPPRVPDASQLEFTASERLAKTLLHSSSALPVLSLPSSTSPKTAMSSRVKPDVTASLPVVTNSVLPGLTPSACVSSAPALSGPASLTLLPTHTASSAPLCSVSTSLVPGSPMLTCCGLSPADALSAASASLTLPSPSSSSSKSSSKPPAGDSKIEAAHVPVAASVTVFPFVSTPSSVAVPSIPAPSALSTPMPCTDTCCASSSRVFPASEVPPLSSRSSVLSNSSSLNASLNVSSCMQLGADDAQRSKCFLQSTGDCVYPKGSASQATGTQPSVMSSVAIQGHVSNSEKPKFVLAAEQCEPLLAKSAEAPSAFPSKNHSARSLPFAVSESRNVTFFSSVNASENTAATDALSSESETSKVRLGKCDDKNGSFSSELQIRSSEPRVDCTGADQEVCTASSWEAITAPIPESHQEVLSCFVNMSPNQLADFLLDSASSFRQCSTTALEATPAYLPVIPAVPSNVLECALPPQAAPSLAAATSAAAALLGFTPGAIASYKPSTLSCPASMKSSTQKNNDCDDCSSSATVANVASADGLKAAAAPLRTPPSQPSMSSPCSAPASGIQGNFLPQNGSNSVSHEVSLHASIGSGAVVRDGISLQMGRCCQIPCVFSRTSTDCMPASAAVAQRLASCSAVPACSERDAFVAAPQLKLSEKSTVPNSFVSRSLKSEVQTTVAPQVVGEIVTAADRASPISSSPVVLGSVVYQSAPGQNVPEASTKSTFVPCICPQKANTDVLDISVGCSDATASMPVAECGTEEKRNGESSKAPSSQHCLTHNATERFHSNSKNASAVGLWDSSLTAYPSSSQNTGSSETSTMPPCGECRIGTATRVSAIQNGAPVASSSSSSSFRKNESVDQSTTGLYNSLIQASSHFLPVPSSSSASLHIGPSASSTSCCSAFVSSTSSAASDSRPLAQCAAGVALPCSLFPAPGGTPGDALEEGFQGEDGLWYRRPDIDDRCLEELCDLVELKKRERNCKLFVDYERGVSFPLGEGGRELLRACLNTKGCKGRRLQGASVPVLLKLAYDWGLWNVAIRIKIERVTGDLCPKHEAFVRFKAMQSHLRKYLKREQMYTERDGAGHITDIRFEEMKYLTLGKEGREKLRTQLRRLHDRDPYRMDDLLERYGFKYSELRNATVPQLLKMAHVCCMWDEVIDACKKQEAKRDSRFLRRLEKGVPQRQRPDHQPIGETTPTSAQRSTPTGRSHSTHTASPVVEFPLHVSPTQQSSLYATTTPLASEQRKYVLHHPELTQVEDKVAAHELISSGFTTTNALGIPRPTLPVSSHLRNDVPAIERDPVLNVSTPTNCGVPTLCPTGVGNTTPSSLASSSASHELPCQELVRNAALGSSAIVTSGMSSTRHPTHLDRHEFRPDVTTDPLPPHLGFASLDDQQSGSPSNTHHQCTEMASQQASSDHSYLQSLVGRRHGQGITSY